MSEVATTLIDESAYEHVFQQKESSSKLEEEKEPGDFDGSQSNENALKANQDKLFPLEVRRGQAAE